MDERPYQLLGEAREPLPMRPGDTWKIDSEYISNDTQHICVCGGLEWQTAYKCP